MSDVDTSISDKSVDCSRCFYSENMCKQCGGSRFRDICDYSLYKEADIVKMLESAEAEVQRLREALEKICNHRIPCFNDEGEEMGYTMPPAYIREIAREALEVRE